MRPQACAVRKKETPRNEETLEASRPSRAQFLAPVPPGTGKTYMFSIMTCPKPEQLTCVAPSIRRAKS